MKKSNKVFLKKKFYLFLKNKNNLVMKKSIINNNNLTVYLHLNCYNNRINLLNKKIKKICLISSVFRSVKKKICINRLKMNDVLIKNFFINYKIF